MSDFYCCDEMFRLFNTKMAWYSAYDRDVHNKKTLLVRFSDGFRNANYNDMNVKFCPFCGEKQ